MRIDADTSMSPGTLEAALRAAGAAGQAVDEVMAGRFATPSRPCARPATTPSARRRWASASSTTPPSRPATPRRRTAPSASPSSTGTSTTATAPRTSSGAIRACSTARPTRCRSIPGTGAVSERGEHGTIVNAPLRAGDGGDAFREALETVILPRVEAFGPDLIVISAGFDAHWRDPLADLQAHRGRLRLGDQEADGHRRAALRRARSCRSWRAATTSKGSPARPQPTSKPSCRADRAFEALGFVDLSEPEGMAARGTRRRANSLPFSRSGRRRAGIA